MGTQLTARNNLCGFFISGRNYKNQSPGWLVSLLIGDYLAWFGSLVWRALLNIHYKIFFITNIHVKYLTENKYKKNIFL